MAKKQKEVATATIDAVEIMVPIGQELDNGYETIQARSGRVVLGQGVHVNAQLMPAEAKTFLRIREGLRTEGERLPDGKPVWTNVDTLRWLMHRIEAAEMSTES